MARLNLNVGKRLIDLSLVNSSKIMKREFLAYFRQQFKTTYTAKPADLCALNVKTVSLNPTFCRVVDSCIFIIKHITVNIGSYG